MSVSVKARRRRTLEVLLGLPTVAVCNELMHAGDAHASALSNAWEVMGGGPSDLTFPEEFLGRWTVCNHNGA